MGGLKWRDDPEFVGWLVKQEYAHVVKDKIQPLLTQGMVLYMFEAWNASRSHARHLK